MAALIKPTTIPLAGYVSQTFVGFKLLAEWLDDPGRYDWMTFEADEKGAKGLDDLVATACCTHVETSLFEAYERVMGRRVAHACSVKNAYGERAIKTDDCIIGTT